jgi:hypothetical protein
MMIMMMMNMVSSECKNGNLKEKKGYSEARTPSLGNFHRIRPSAVSMLT